MLIVPFNSTRRVILDPGEFYVSRQPEVISTLLGSCVAACLFDPVTRIFGMNHFLLAYRHYAQEQRILESDVGRYGIYAMEVLINEMMRQGAGKRNLKAKCFGGAQVLHLREDKMNHTTVGDANIEFIKAFLLKEDIPLLGSSFGGIHGRHIHFVGTDYSVYIKKIGTMQDKMVEKEERRYWKQNLEEREKIGNKADFW